MLRNIYHLYSAHKNSNLKFEDFIRRYQAELSQINIGCSLNPEHQVFESIEDSQRRKKKIFDCAKFIVEDLEMTEIRLSIRWNRVFENGKINFAYYNDIFRYFLNQNVKICLNIGPIKTMRWPEEHVPSEILNVIKKVPKKGSVIRVEDELAQLSIKYLEQLLKLLKNTFSETQLNKIISWQLNNEAFNKFGEHKWITSLELESEFIKIVKRAFPNSKILLNSSGRNNMRKNLELIKKTEFDPSSFILGYNYYYKVPGQAENFILKYLDNLILTNPFSIGTRRLKQLSSRQDFEIEVAELQAEPWLHLKSPGNSAKEFKFAIIRSIQDMLNLDQSEKSVIRYWGIEELIIKFLTNEISDEHKEIFEIIHSINLCSNTKISI